MTAFKHNLNRILTANHMFACSAMMVGLSLWVISDRTPCWAPLNGLAMLIGLGGIGFLLTRGKSAQPWSHRHDSFSAVHGLILVLLVTYLSSGTSSLNWFFMPNWSLSEGSFNKPLSSWLVRALILTLPLAVLIKRYPGCLKTGVLAGFALFTLLACLQALGSVTNFEPIYRVDHPSFYYRYATFLEAFPHPGFYDPYWNAGVGVPYLVASGVWALALPWYPLLRVIPLDVLYTPMLACTFLVLVPLSGYVATRLFGGSSRAGWITALLFMVPAQRYFVHILHYGTAPSIFSISLSALILGLIWYLLQADTRSRLAWSSLGLIAVGGLALCWPGSLLLGVPLAVTMLIAIRLWKLKPLLCLLGCACVLFVLLFPLARVPMRYSAIEAFMRSYESLSFREHFFSGRSMLAGLFKGIHPLIAVLGLTTFFLDPDRLRGRVMGGFIFAALVTAGWGEEFSPLLQWERLIIPATMVGAVAAGLGIDRLLERQSIPHTLTTLTNAWILALLILGGYRGGRIYGDRGAMDFQTMPDHTRELVGWLNENVPEGSRVLIAGQAVHGYGGAKVAAMPLWVEREMISSDYYGFSPKLVEFQCPPRHVLQHGPDAVFEYLDLHNVSYTMTYHQGWKDAFERHPDYYTLRFQSGRVNVYEVHRPLNMFYRGEGTVRAGINHLHIDLASDDELVVVKYNWVDGWRIPAPAEVFPYELEYELTFIGIRPHGLSTFTLEHRP